MKNIFSTLLLCCTLVGVSYAQPPNTAVSVGQKAPELEFSDPRGETLKLSKIAKDRIVLVDFWASWCRPCRYANPGLVKMYDRYKDKKFKDAKKGFTILSVSMDQNKEAWIKAIETDKLTWEYHMSDLGGWESKTAQLYGVQYIPQAFLVMDGKIIGMYNSAEDADPVLQKMLK